MSKPVDWSITHSYPEVPMSTRTLFIQLGIASLFLFACQDETSSPTGATNLDNPSASANAALVQIQPSDPAVPLPLEGSCVDLLTSDSRIAGNVCASVDGDFLQIVYTTNTGWSLKETRTWTDTTFATQPINPAGNAELDQFPMVHDGLAVSTDTARVPLSNFALSSNAQTCAPLTVDIIAYAKVKPAQGGAVGAYGAGTLLPDPNRSGVRAFSVVLECIPAERGPLSCEGTYAYDEDLAIAFNSQENQPSNNWGWTNGPLQDGDYEFTLYAHAAQNDLEKGTALGRLSVKVADDTVSLEFAKMADGPDAWFTTTHVYVGDMPLPMNRKGAYTAAPGQFGNQHDLDTSETDTYHIAIAGPVYVAAKAEVCVEME